MPCRLCLRAGGGNALTCASLTGRTEKKKKAEKSKERCCKDCVFKNSSAHKNRMQ